VTVKHPATDHFSIRELGKIYLKHREDVVFFVLHPLACFSNVPITNKNTQVQLNDDILRGCMIVDASCNVISFEIIMQNYLYYPELELCYVSSPDILPHNLKGHRFLFPQLEFNVLVDADEDEENYNITTQNFVVENMQRIRAVMCENFHVSQMFERLQAYINRAIHRKYAD
jgi:hypothetical protein